MLTNVRAPRLIPLVPGQRRRKKPFDISRLPADIFVVLIAEHLSIFDRAALALVCKAFAERINSLSSAFRIPAVHDDDPCFDATTTFFRNTMRQWFPDHLKFCEDCGKYLPKDKIYWQGTLPKECMGRPGKAAKKFVAQDAKGGMDILYENWEEVPQSRICPRCRLHMPPYY